MMQCGLRNMDHASWITRATFFEIAVYIFPSTSNGVTVTKALLLEKKYGL